MKVSCDVIRDLMILCEDEDGSEESKRLVEAHKKDCRECGESSEQDGLVGSPSPEEQMIKREGEQLLKEAVFQLEEPYREVFILRAFAELRFKEIAEKYSKTEEWARVTYYRAKSKVQATLQRLEGNK